MTSLPHIHTELAPGEPLVTDRSRSQLLRVVAGVVYVRGEDDDMVLTPGDSTSLSAGDARRIWNAGDETARLFVSESPEARLPKAA